MTEPPKAAEKNSNVTESTGKVCSACEDKKLKAAFSKKQWLEPAATRRCTECVTANKPTKPTNKTTTAPATHTPAPTTTHTQPSSSSTTTATTTTTQPTQQQQQSQQHQKLRANKTIPHARIQPKKHTKRPPLLDNDGDWFLPAAETALIEIFNRFDSDSDGYWSIKETQSFATATNGKPFTTEELYEVTNHFFKENKLPQKGFLQFYHLQTSSHPAETWKDMQKLGYSWEVKTGEIIPPPHVVKQQQQQQQQKRSEGSSNGSKVVEAATTTAASAAAS